MKRGLERTQQTASSQEESCVTTKRPNDLTLLRTISVYLPGLPSLVVTVVSPESQSNGIGLLPGEWLRFLQKFNIAEIFVSASRLFVPDQMLSADKIDIYP